MLCIACCDDDAVWLGDFVRRLDRLMRTRGEPFRIYSYSDGASLMRALKDPGVDMDLLFLDIMLDQQDGLVIAAILRTLRPRLPVVLVSSSPEFALESYAVHPAHYLLKPANDTSLASALDYCFALHQNPGQLVIRWKKIEKVLPLSEILYIEVLDSLLKLHTRAGNEYQTGGHLTHLEQQLPPGQFLRCHKSYLVNLDYAEGIRRYVLLLAGGQKVPVSKQNYAAVKEAYLHYGRHCFA